MSSLQTMLKHCGYSPAAAKRSQILGASAHGGMSGMEFAFEYVSRPRCLCSSYQRYSISRGNVMCHWIKYSGCPKVIDQRFQEKGRRAFCMFNKAPRRSESRRNNHPTNANVRSIFKTKKKRTATLVAREFL